MENGEQLIRQSSADCVVMLTWSNWWTELRSNRFHYATRWAVLKPVIFVQPDLEAPQFQYEKTPVENIEILHVWAHYGPTQSRLLNEALRSRNFISSLLWIYNPCFWDFVISTYARLTIYHATEDYFSNEVFGAPNPDDIRDIQQVLRDLLRHVDLLVAVSEGVRQSYVVNGRYAGECLVLTNGCDFEFWVQGQQSDQPAASSKDHRIALYSGGISQKIDFGLLRQVIVRMPDWQFWFCGEAFSCFEEWQAVQRLPNVKFWGKFSPEQVRDLSYQATVGIIPYKQESYITKKSFPLKAFEYVACGLPVVSVPIDTLQDYPTVFMFASEAGGFRKAIEEARATRHDSKWIEERRRWAAAQSYSLKFERLQETLQQAMPAKGSNDDALNILVLYDSESAKVNTVNDHLLSFARFSRHHIYYAACTGEAQCSEDLSLFDVVIVHYAVRVNFPLEAHGPNLMSASYALRLRQYGGYKILFIQDEYDDTELARRWIEHFGIHAVYTCVPDPYIERIYPKSRFPYAEFVPTLTGFVPIALERAAGCKPMAERRFLIGYRGRELPWWYGDLGREKFLIGKRMREICESRRMPVNIEWENDKRIYGEGWFQFIEDCRATLGTESGANVFDETGSIRRQIEELKAKDPMISYEKVQQEILAGHEGKIRMNQISPKIFEAIALRTALVLFEGDYSDVIQPNVHYIPLKKDFNNIEEVLDKLHDEIFLTRITEKAHQDIIQSENYSYRAFVRGVDDYIGHRVKGQKAILLSNICGYQHWDSKQIVLFNLPVETFKAGMANTFISPHHIITRSEKQSNSVNSSQRIPRVSPFPYWLEVIRVKLTDLLRVSLKFLSWTISKVQKGKSNRLDQKMYDFCRSVWHKVID